MSRSFGLLARMLGPTGEDAGCERTLEMLDAYVDQEAAGQPAATLYPDVARHLVGCPDCRGDETALLDLVRLHATVQAMPEEGPPSARGASGSS